MPDPGTTCSVGREAGRIKMSDPGAQASICLVIVFIVYYIICYFIVIIDNYFL